MAEIERNMQEEEQLSGDDDSSSFIQNSEDIEEEEAELGRSLELQGSVIRKLFETMLQLPVNTQNICTIVISRLFLQT